MQKTKKPRAKKYSSPFAQSLKYRYPKWIRQENRKLTISPDPEEGCVNATLKINDVRVAFKKFYKNNYEDVTEFLIRQTMNFMENCEVWIRSYSKWIRESDYPEDAYYWAKDRTPLV